MQLRAIMLNGSSALTRVSCCKFGSLIDMRDVLTPNAPAFCSLNPSGLIEGWIRPSYSEYCKNRFRYTELIFSAFERYCNNCTNGWSMPSSANLSSDHAPPSVRFQSGTSSSMSLSMTCCDEPRFTPNSSCPRLVRSSCSRVSSLRRSCVYSRSQATPFTSMRSVRFPVATSMSYALEAVGRTFGAWCSHSRTVNTGSRAPYTQYTAHGPVAVIGIVRHV